jgi:hypothetical protein
MIVEESAAIVAGGGVGGGWTLAGDGTRHANEPFELTMEMNAYGTFDVTRLTDIAPDREPHCVRRLSLDYDVNICKMARPGERSVDTAPAARRPGRSGPSGGVA